MIKYRFKEDEPLTIKSADKANPQKIGEALTKISAINGGHLVPAAVVEAARDAKSVLHKHFEWNDKTAAEKFRLDQARSLIRCIHVESEDAESGVTRAFLSIREKTGVSYRTITDVLNSADLQQRLLAQAEKDLLAFEARYQNLEDICSLIRAARERLAVRQKQAGQDNRVVS
jgi:hypothetical protein